MNENLLQRKLVAILMADVKGYSQLMADDDEHTVMTISSYRDIIGELITAHQGCVVDSSGDNIMAEFGSALNAVTSAIAIQNRLCSENDILPKLRRMSFRIGITLGDIIQQDDRIYGDGVNMAARIQRFAEPGGICISSGVYDQVKKRIGGGVWDMGKHSVKNIPDPVRIYQVRLEPDKEKMRFFSLNHRNKKMLVIAVIGFSVVIAGFMLGIGIPEMTEEETIRLKTVASHGRGPPTIVILPFVDLSGDVDRSCVCKGIYERIITSLSTEASVVVIAGHSPFADKTTAEAFARMPLERSVRYILEGSVQCFNGRFRMNIRLLNVQNAHYIWAGQYDRNLNDLFALQDEIATNVLDAVMQKLLTNGANPIGLTPVNGNPKTRRYR